MSLLERAWWEPRPGPGTRLLLAPLLLAEAAFRAGVAARNALHDLGWAGGGEAGAPVISVGNLTVGGSGKTPVTLELARRLAARGRTVAVLSRGYGALRRDERVVADGVRVLLGAAEGGDEPVLLARRLPGLRVLCGPRRRELARRAIDAHRADALLLDDGFQHRALARDLDVVVIDAANPLGNGHLLPAGPGREPRAALARAGLVWLSRCDQARPEEVARWRGLARDATGRDPVESRHAPVDVVDGALARSLGREALRGRAVLLLSGLARPGAFRATVEALGARVVGERRYPDHHRYGAAELAGALAAAGDAGASAVVTTEKDAVRFDPAAAADPRWAVVRIEAEVIAGERALEEALAGALAAGDRRRGRGSA